MNKKVTIYSTPTCHFCNMAKDYFKENNVEYTAFDVSVDQDKRKEMMEKSGQLGVPVIIIGDKIIIGFNKPKIAELLDIK
ncbi:MAG TPA: glutaredoxin family protein [Candidatus Paceibacterota bacterium]